MSDFLEHTKRSGGGHLFAAQVTTEGIEYLSKVVHGEVSSATSSYPDTLSFADPGGYNQTAEIGDYVVSDLAGGFRVVDKEIFEAQYVKIQGI